MQALKLKIATGAIVLFFLLLLGATFFTPASWHTERTVLIQADAETIFPYINNLQRWSEWALWYSDDPKVLVTYEGPQAGVNAISKWKDSHGSGIIKIVGSEEDESVGYNLFFDSGWLQMEGTITLNPTDLGTEVVWQITEKTDLNPLHKLLAWRANNKMGQDLEHSLALLKAIIENPTPKHSA